MNEQDQVTAASSVLVSYLLSRMVWGAVSPQEIQKIAALAQKNFQQGGQALREIDVLAGVGCSGQYPNKVYGDIMARCAP